MRSLLSLSSYSHVMDGTEISIVYVSMICASVNLAYWSSQSASVYSAVFQQHQPSLMQLQVQSMRRFRIGYKRGDHMAEVSVIYFPFLQVKG